MEVVDDYARHRCRGLSRRELGPVLSMTRDHLGSGQALHFCLGAPLARLHGEVALSILFTRLPGLAARTPPDITASVPIRQVDQFRVSWPQN